MWRLFLLIISTLFCVGQSYAQDEPLLKENRKFLRSLKQFEKKWEGKPFPIDLRSKKSFGDHIYKPTKQAPVMVFVGSKGCPPCRKQLKLLQNIAQKNPNYNFIYLTSDISDTVSAHVKELAYDVQKTPNLQIISIKEQEFEESGVKDLGSPIKYYLDQNFRIRSVSALDRAEDAAVMEDEAFGKMWMKNLE